MLIMNLLSMVEAGVLASHPRGLRLNIILDFVYNMCLWGGWCSRRALASHPRGLMLNTILDLASHVRV